MKKFLLFLSAIVLFATNTFGALAASFPDVQNDHKNYQAIEYLDEKQIISGYSDGTFGPDNLVNRAEATKIIVNALGIAHDGNYEILFPDVKKTEWYFPFVMGAKKADIISGYSDGKFKPGNTVNLAETLKILFTAGKIELPTDVPDSFFVDVKKSDWFAPYMLYARNHNIIFSDDYGYAHPDQAMSRAAFAEVVYRTMIVIEKKGQPFPLETTWSQYSGSELPFQMKYDKATWQVTQHNDEVIFMKPDKQFSQFSAARIYPNTGLVRVVLDTNDTDMVEDQYFTNIKAAFAGGKFKKFSMKGFNALEVLFEEKRIVDWYIYLENGDVLAVYTEYGSGPLGYQLQQFIKTMLSTLEYKKVNSEQDDENDKLLSAILKNILVEGEGMNMINSLPDKIILETDTIGVGTGPVDYYYSEGLNYTFKYERSADVLLDSREGNTTTF